MWVVTDKLHFAQIVLLLPFSFLSFFLYIPVSQKKDFEVVNRTGDRGRRKKKQNKTENQITYGIILNFTYVPFFFPKSKV